MKKNQHFTPFTFKLIIGISIFVCMFFIAMIFGAADIKIKDVILAFSPNTVGEKISIIRDIRLPREIAAIFVGAALAVSGTIMQGMTRNPLADPGLFGLTSGANAALALTFVLFPTANYLGITITCFIGAAFGAILVLGIGTMKKGGFSTLRIVLAGAAISTFLTAISEGLGIYFKMSKNISMWTAGGMVGTSWGQLKVIIPFIIIGILASLFLSRQLTILSLSEEVSVGLGQKTTQIKLILFILITLLSGASVALVGNLVFIGLMVPHMVLSFVGTDYRFIIPMSTIMGAAFMLLADTLSRTINAPYETPVAAIIALIGLPFFLVIVRKGGKAFS